MNPGTAFAISIFGILLLLSVVVIGWKIISDKEKIMLAEEIKEQEERALNV